ncbi:deiodinase-like protein [Verrucomicrobiales bacterium BCK34]|nr:deiodinase-like protein [Verrucomicrobiales bacterium BCK34]
MSSGKFRFCCICFAVFVAVVPELRADDGEPGPKDRDDFSGKKIATQRDGYEIIKERFYNAPKYGDPAPDFELIDQKTGEKVTLASLRAEKPVVLMFGSWGCDVMRNGFWSVLKSYETYGDRYHFVMIYVREAHSLDGTEQKDVERARVVDPDTFAERSLAAAACRAAVKIPFRILLDTMDDKVATRWAGWPVRLFVVERDGTVVYSGKPGPWGFNPGGGFKSELADQLRPHAERFNQESLEDFLATHAKEKK